jgi:hypothetical protein
MQAEDFTRQVRARVLAGKTFNKIFCVGWNKTGTTTLEGLLRLYGYNLPNQQEQSLRLTRACFACDYTELKSFVAHYDAFQDMPFPGSRFILSERDGDAWFDSLTRFYRKIYGLDQLDNLTREDVREKFTYLYRGYSLENFERQLTRYDKGTAELRWDLLFDRAFHIGQYRERNARIKHYFRNCPERLLVIDVTVEKTTRALCDFLNIPAEFAIDMPQLNKT